MPSSAFSSICTEVHFALEGSMPKGWHRSLAPILASTKGHGIDALPWHRCHALTEPKLHKFASVSCISSFCSSAVHPNQSSTPTKIRFNASNSVLILQTSHTHHITLVHHLKSLLYTAFLQVAALAPFPYLNYSNSSSNIPNFASLIQVSFQHFEHHKHLI